MSTLFLLAGVAGSGKSTLAPRLTQAMAELGRPVAALDPDLWFGPMERALLEGAGAAPDDRDSQVFKTLARPARYEGLWRGAQLVLDCGCDALAIAPFTAEAREGKLLRITQKRFGRHEVRAVWLYAGERARRERILARARPEDAVKLAAWESYERGLPDLAQIKGMPLVENETGQDCLEELLRAFKLIA